MKTIEEKMNEAFKQAGENAYFGNGFKAGYNAAFEWISVDEELPPKEIDRKLSIDVLCKLNDEEVIVSYYNFVSKTWILNNNKNIVTHWRLIEIN
jgi:hypothetical protein